jgi:hypothetical protein
MKLRYPFLQRMWPINIPNALHGDDMLAINANEWEQARIDCKMLYPLGSTAMFADLQYNRTGSASSLTTS